MARSAKPFLLRDPTLSKAHIAFSYGGNIWIANRDGGELRRLTSAGRESKPAFSPDGAQIAFIGEYGEPRGVFVVPVTGGEPRRLTYHPADLGVYLGVTSFKSGDVVGWTPDGARVFFSSHRAAFAGGMLPVVQLFTVPAEGGFAIPLPLNRAAQGSFSPDGTRIAYVPHAQWQPECKRYRGGQARFIWIAGLADSSIEAGIPRDNSNDFNPMWVRETIYFLSDRNGPVTLFSYDVRSQELEQIVQNEGLDIKSASALSDTIVYEQFGSLHLLDLKSGRDRVLDIRPLADFPEVRPRVENVADFLVREGEFEKIKPKLSPRGARAVLGVRGRIVTVPADQGDIRVLTQESGVAERDPAWSPDGQSIAYFSDESGEYALHVRDQSGLGAVRKIELGSPPSFFYSPTWSPDSKKIAYTDKRLNYWYVDLDKRTPVRVDTDLFTDPGRGSHDLQLAWSPDSRWIAYIKQLPGHLHAVFVYSIEEDKSYPLTDGMSDALYVAFDPEGEYLYFTASTDAGPAADWFDMTSLYRPVTRSVYALVLRKGGATPLPPQSDEEKSQAAGERPHQAATVEQTATVRLDFEGIGQRIVRLPVPARNYYGLFAGPPRTLFLVEGPQIDEPFSLAGYPLQKVHRLDLSTRKSEQILDEVIYFELSLSGEKMLYGKQLDKEKRWFITAAQKATDASRDSAQGLLKLDSLRIAVDPRAEWRQMYEEAWRQERDFFYDPGLHGLDLEQVKKTYEPFLENIVTREDLDYLFQEMLANLTVLHLGAVGGEARKPKHSTTGLLGADYSVENGRYRFARIYDRDPWSGDSRAPLRELGMSVQAGEYLLAVNGREVHPSADVCSYFAGTAGKQVVLKVGPKPDGSGSREVIVVPIDDEYALRHFAWIEGNRCKVDELTGGRVAYVYLPDCRGVGYRAFNRYFFAQAGKDAAIIDERYNNGGLGPQYIIDCLRRPLRCYWHMREGRDITTPMLGIFGPKVMLINETSASSGDCLAWSFRKAGIGPLIGTRTWGGLVGFYLLAPDLLDGGYVNTPNLAFYSPDGAWEVENHGVPPDIEVEDDPKTARSGHDAQLEKAIEVVMDLLKKNPPRSVAQHPRYPNYYRGK